MTSVLLSKAHKRVVVPYSDNLAHVMPDAPSIAIKGVKHLAVPHDEDHTKVLRNFGFDVPAPVSLYYDYNRKTPFDVQRKTVELLTVEKRAYVLNGMGTGKTKAALWAFDYLHNIGAVKKLLVCATLSTLTNTWAREVFATIPHHKTSVLHGSKEQRQKRLANKDASIYIINHDGLITIKSLLRDHPDIDMVIIDELAVYRNGSTTRHRVLREILANKKYVAGMTGSPAPESPVDVWAQARLITPHTANMTKGRFTDEVMRKVSTFKWVPKPDAMTRALTLLQPSVRFTLDDVVELPDVVHETVDVAQGAKQTLVYKELSQKFTTMFAEGDVTAVNSAVLANKLLQVAMGYVYTNERGVVSLDNDARLDVLLDRVQGSERKVIVFVPYIHGLDGVSKFLTKHHIANEVVSGQTSVTQRNRVFNLFQNTDQPKVIVAHPKCMSHGLTLTEADRIIWFSPYPSLETFDQANARIRRVGQAHKQHIIMLAGTAVERRMYQRLVEKQNVQSVLLDMLREQTRDATGV